MSYVPNTWGVYAITNAVTGSAYIGAAVELRGRWCCHRGMLSRGKHYNRHLQSARTEHGADAFRFVVLELIRSRDYMDVRRAEHDWVERYKAEGVPLYNIAPIERVTRVVNGKIIVEEYDDDVLAYPRTLRVTGEKRGRKKKEGA